MRTAWNRHLPRAIATLGAVLVVACCGVPAVRAQGPGPGGPGGPVDPTQVRAALERTDGLLQRCREVVEASGNPRAIEQLSFAQQSQDIAWGQYNQGHNRIALDATLRARDLGERAIRLAQQQGDAEQQARRAVDDASRALERAQQCASDMPSENQRRMLEVAQQQLAQSQDALQQMRWQVAAGLAQQVLNTVRLVCSQQPCPRVDEMLDDVQRLYDRAAHDVPADDPHSRDVLDQARDLLDRGREALQRGACDAAFVQARQARDMILRVLRSHEGEPDAAAVDRAIDDAARFIETVSQRVPAESGAAQALLEAAGRHLQQARDQRQQQRLRAALAETRVARNLALRAERLATGGRF